MAISFVGSGTVIATGASGATYNFSSLRDEAGSAPTIVEGDTVFLIVGKGHNGASSISTPTDYQSSGSNIMSANDTNDVAQQLYYKRMGATPDTSVDIPAPGAGCTFSVGVAVLRGVDATTVMDVARVGLGFTNGGAPNPGAITPATTGAWLILTAATSGALAAGVGTLTPPASGVSTATNHFRTETNTGATQYVSSAFVLKTDWAGGAFDCPAFGNSNSNAANCSVAGAFAIRPAATGVDGSGSGSAGSVTSSIPSGSAGGAANASAGSATATNSAPGGTGTATALGGGSAATLVASSPTAAGSGNASAAAASGTAGASAPGGTAVADGSASSGLAAVSGSQPSGSGTGAGSGVVAASSVAAIAADGISAGAAAGSGGLSAASAAGSDGQGIGSGEGAGSPAAAATTSAGGAGSGGGFATAPAVSATATSPSGTILVGGSASGSGGAGTVEAEASAGIGTASANGASAVDGADASAAGGVASGDGLGASASNVVYLFPPAGAAAGSGGFAVTPPKSRTSASAARQDAFSNAGEQPVTHINALSRTTYAQRRVA